jgi:antitoxin (DNA-binding transcriptional repressor) of toxin-antitoxin stability system
MATISIHEAQSRLSELIHQLAPGEEVAITEDDRPVARLTAAGRPMMPPRPPGFLRGSVLDMAPGFDEPLDDFKEYIE